MKHIQKRKKADADEIVKGFVNKYSKYKEFRSEIYEKICQLKTPDIRK